MSPPPSGEADLATISEAYAKVTEDVTKLKLVRDADTSEEEPTPEIVPEIAPESTPEPADEPAPDGPTGEADLATISEAYAKMTADVEALRQGQHELHDAATVESERMNAEMTRKFKEVEARARSKGEMEEGEQATAAPVTVTMDGTDEHSHGKVEVEVAAEAEAEASDVEKRLANEDTASTADDAVDAKHMAEFLGFTPAERDVMTKTQFTTTLGLTEDPAAAREWAEWVEQWQCLPDEAHRYEGQALNDHCLMSESKLPGWARKDPYVSTAVARGEARTVNGARLAAKFRGKRVFFNGDSIVEQLMRAWNCDMSQVGLGEGEAEPGEEARTKEAFLEFAKANEGSDFRFIADEELRAAVKSGLAKRDAGEGGGGGGTLDGSPWSMMTFRLGDRKIEDWMKDGKAAKMLAELDVVILHFGLHYHEEEKMREGYEALMPILDEFAAKPGKAALLLEMGHQHFSSPSGAYEDRNPLTNKCYCMPLADNDDGDGGDAMSEEHRAKKRMTSGRWRNEVIGEFLSKYKNVKLIPFEKLTAPRFAMHMKSRKLRGDGCDCTHWCYSMQFWRATMGGMYDALEGKEGFF